MLTIVKAEDVREGEPRLWWPSLSMPTTGIYLDMLHLDSREACGCPGALAAIVDRPAAPPQPDPREEEVWRVAFNCETGRGCGVEYAASKADAAADEWRKRWGAK